MRAAFTFPLQNKTCCFWRQKPEVTPRDTKSLAALPVPCATDSRETTRALVPSPCRGCFSRWDRAGDRRNSSLSPARCRGSAAWSVATRRSEPASRWPAGGGTAWIPPPRRNEPLQPQRIHETQVPLKRGLDFPLPRLQWLKPVTAVRVNKVHKQIHRPPLNTSLENLVLALKKPSYLPQIWLEAVNHHSERWSALAHTCVHLCRAEMRLPRERDRQPELLLPDGNSEKDLINPVTRDVLKPWLVKVRNKRCNCVHLQR